MVALSSADKQAIVRAINEAERLTGGEVRVHVQRQSKGSAFETAKKVFRRLGMHKTAHHSGVLIFIALDSREFAIVGDRAIHEKVGDAFWQNTRDLMLEYFKQNRLKDGIVAGVLSAGEKLRECFPRKAGDKNELSNDVSTE